ncbi:MAG: FHA domain-containing protein [Actinobacteria bacterium]|nr:FHA domain-containing protein [Actinomycetota bacterium]
MASAWVQWPRRDAPGLHRVELPAAGAALVGRRRQASIRIDDDGTVSREHAALSHLDGAWLLADVDSGSGTYLLRDGQRERVKRPRRLRHGDRICVGKTVLTFHCPPASGEPGRTDPVEQTTIELTRREQELLALLCSEALAGRGGWPSNAALARALVISENTLRDHLKALYEKFGLGDAPVGQRRSQLIRRASDGGWV